MSVSEAQTKISSAEFTEWAVYNQLEPFNTNTTNVLLAYIVTILTNSFKKPGGRKFIPADFLPGKKRVKINTAEEMEKKLRAMFP